MSYADLSDEDKLAQAIEFVAVGHTLPTELREFLVEHNLYEIVTQPGAHYVKIAEGPVAPH